MKRLSKLLATATMNWLKSTWKAKTFPLKKSKLPSVNRHWHASSSPYSAAPHTRTKVSRCFWMLSLITSRPRWIFLRLKVLPWTAKKKNARYPTALRWQPWHSRSWQIHSLANWHTSAYIPAKCTRALTFSTPPRTRKNA